MRRSVKRKIQPVEEISSKDYFIVSFVAHHFDRGKPKFSDSDIDRIEINSAPFTPMATNPRLVSNSRRKRMRGLSNREKGKKEANGPVQNVGYGCS
jgi:hypothetical protein